MAFGIFKKNRPEEQKAVSNEAPAVTTKPIPDPEPSEKTVGTDGFVMKDSTQAEYFIREKFDIFEKSPLKVLYNIFKSDQAYQPMEYMWKALIETNQRLNEIGQDTFPEYQDYDENQKDFMAFVNEVQAKAVKTVTQLLLGSVEGTLDDYMDGVDKEGLSASLPDYCECKSYEEWKLVSTPKTDEPRKKPMDAQILLRTSKDKIHSWLIVFPPFNNGSEMTDDKLQKSLDAGKVIYGVNKPLISAVTGKKQYLRIFEIARGEEVIDGKDGYVIDMYPRSNEIKVIEDENGVVNFKELNNIRSVHKDDLICEIHYPIPGTDGRSVEGRIITARKGTPPKIPKGRNTIYADEEKTQLVADRDGELLFKEGGFNVNELLTINGDVDVASGNIHFSGDVLVKGDVREGFAVTAEGNITIEGTCEGAELQADGSIIIAHGMTGGGKGKLHAGGGIKCMFLENCQAFAEGDIEVDQVVFSQVSSGENIIVTGKKGSVTGGKLIAGKAITADIIGAPSNPALKTDIVLGAAPELIKNHSTTSHNLKDVSAKLFKINQDIAYIEENIKRMPENRVAKLDQLKIQRKFVDMQKNNLQNTLDKLTEELEETKKACSLTCKSVNPTVNFRVGESTYLLHKQVNNCKLYVSDNVTVISGSNLAQNIEF